MSISKNLKALRKQKGITQQGLADKAGISKMSLSRYEKGDRIPTIKILEKLALALDVDVDEIYDKVIVPQNEWSEDLDAVAIFSTQAMKDENRQKIAKLLNQLSDQQLRQVILILEALADNSKD